MAKATSILLIMLLPLSLYPTSEVSAADRNLISVSILDDGSFYWSGETFSLAQIKALFRYLKRKGETGHIHLRATNSVETEILKQLVKAAAEFGYNDIIFQSYARGLTANDVQDDPELAMSRIRISVDRSGMIRSKDGILSRENFESAIYSSITTSPLTALTISADPDTPFENVFELIELSRRHNLGPIEFEMIPQPLGPLFYMKLIGIGCILIFAVSYFLFRRDRNIRNRIPGTADAI